MMAYTLSIANRDSARAELGAELSNTPSAMAKYRRHSVLLLVPLSVAILVLIKRRASEPF
jgi:hypothetical protein